MGGGIFLIIFVFQFLKPIKIYVMKKMLLLFAAIIAMSFVGCDKDNDEPGSDELVGTKWFYEKGSVLSSYFWQEDITFNSVDKFTYHYMELTNLVATDEGEATGSYKYNPPVVTGSVTMDGVKASMRGEINGSQMTVYINGEKYGIYQKKK